MSAPLIRLGAGCTVAAGALLVAVHTAEALVGFPLPESGAAGLAIAVAFTVHIPLLAVGLVGLHLRQSAEAGRFGLGAFVAALVGVIALGGMVWSALVIDPVLRAEAPALIESEPTAIAAGGLVSLLLFAVGLLLFALATLRAGVLPRAAAGLVAVGLLAAVPLEDVVPGVLVVYPVGLCWLGVAALRTAATTSVPQPALV